jgi:hypothetical protein
MHNLTDLRDRIRKKFLVMIMTALVLIVSLSVSIPVSAWVSNWVIWQFPQPVTYEKNSSSSSLTNAAWDSSITDWSNAQSKVTFQAVSSSPMLYLSFTNDNSVAWDGATQKYQSGNYLYYALSRLNQYRTEDYTPSNKRRSVSGHEIGHAMGLSEGDHDDSLMEQDTSVRYGTYTIYTPQQDDINGINTLYYNW